MISPRILMIRHYSQFDQLRPITHGYPRRCTLLLHSDAAVANKEMLRLVRMYELSSRISKIKDEWAQRMTHRSIFQKLTVLQFILALKEEGCKLTPRIIAPPLVVLCQRQ